MEPLSLLALNQIIKQTLDLELEPSYWVVAEIGEMRLNQKGHCYMELIEKEEESVKAKIRANIWSYTYRNISGWFEAVTHQPLKAGLTILANVTVTFHEIYGISLNVKDIDPKYTLGERARKKQEIIDQLHADGVFDMNKDLELPLIPQNIAVISSSTAAGFGDFVNQLHHNEGQYHFNIQLFQALMQGEDAKEAIINAMHEVFENIDEFDLLVIIRGGGAQVDLDCFDTYDLAAHVAQFPLPVLTGIGHERDETIVDLVAHTKLKTPTAVAAFLIQCVASYDEKLDQLLSSVWHMSNEYLGKQKVRIDQLQYQLKYATSHFVAKNHNQLDRVEIAIKHQSKVVLKTQQQKLKDLHLRLKTQPYSFLINQERRLTLLEKTVELLDPKMILSRGYSISTIGGQLISKMKKLEKGMTMVTTTRDQQIESNIEKVKPN